MKILTISTGTMTEQVFISDEKLAVTSYETLKAAMESCDKYGNDTSKIVSIATGAGEAAYCILNITGIRIDDCCTAEPQIIEREVWRRQLEAKIAMRLAPSNG